MGSAVRQLRLGGRRGGHLVAVVDALEVAADVRLAVALELVGHLALHPGDVAHVVELVVARLDAREHAVVADPVGHALDEPRAAFGAEVVSAGEPEETLRERVVPVHALRRFGDTLLLLDHERGMLVVEPGGDDVPDQVDAEVRLEGDLGGRCEGPLDDRSERVADAHVLPEPARRPGLTPVLLLEAGDVLGRPLRERGVAVLLLLARLRPLDADPGVVAETDAGAVLVVVDGLVRLVERATAAEAALLLGERLEVAVGPQPVAELHRALPLVERAGPDRVHAGEAFREAAVADRAQRVHRLHDDRRREERSPARSLRVLVVEVERAQIADREREVVDRVARHLRPPRTATGEALTDPGPQLRDPVVGDPAVFLSWHRTVSFHRAQRGRRFSKNAANPSRDSSEASDSRNIVKSMVGSWRFRSRLRDVRARGPVSRTRAIVSSSAASSSASPTTRETSPMASASRALTSSAVKRSLFACAIPTRLASRAPR